jgi:hypothetical protein
MGVIQTMTWPMVLIAVHFLLFTVGGVLDPIQLGLILMLMVCCNLVWVAAGVYLSLRFASVTVAVIVSLLLPVITYAGVPAVMTILDELTRSQGDVVELCALYVPYYYMGETVSTGVWRDVYMPVLDQVSNVTFVTFAAGAAALHLGAFFAINALTVGSFDRLVGRARQSDPVGLPGVTRLTASP